MSKSIKKKIIKQTKLRKLNKYGTRKQRNPRNTKKNRTSVSGHKAFPSLFIVSTPLRRTKHVRRRTTNYKKNTRKGGRVIRDSIAEQLFYKYIDPIVVKIDTLDKMDSSNKNINFKKDAIIIIGEINELLFDALNKVKVRILEKNKNIQGDYSENFTPGVVDLFSILLWLIEKCNNIIIKYNKDTQLYLPLLGGQNGGQLVGPKVGQKREFDSDDDTEPESDYDSEEEEDSESILKRPIDAGVNRRSSVDTDDTIPLGWGSFARNIDTSEPNMYTLITEIKQLIKDTWPSLRNYTVKAKDPKGIISAKTGFRKFTRLFKKPVDMDAYEGDRQKLNRNSWNEQ